MINIGTQSCCKIFCSNLVNKSTINNIINIEKIFYGYN